MAGEELLSECKKIGSLKVGDMASTGPAKLNCKRVYHIRAPPWDDGKAAQVYNASLIFNFDFVFYQLVRLSYDDLLCAEHTNRD